MPKQPLPPTGEVILYPTEDGRTRVECRFAGETVWLTQALMAELFGKDVRTINENYLGCGASRNGTYSSRKRNRVAEQHLLLIQRRARWRGQSSCVAQRGGGYGCT